MLQFLVESPWEKKLYRLDGNEILVGRSRAAEIPLLDEGASKRSARIVRSGTELRWFALGGGEVRFNDAPPAVEGRLRVGDRLRIASTVLTLQAILPRRAPEPAPGPKPVSPPPAPEVGGRSVRLDPAADQAFLEGGFRAILEINKRLVAEADEEKLLALVMDAAIDLTGADRGFLLLGDPGGELRSRVARNLEGDPVERPELEVSRTIAKRAMETKRAVISADAGADERWTGMESIAALSLR